jgi:hypothetical protein
MSLQKYNVHKLTVKAASYYNQHGIHVLFQQQHYLVAYLCQQDRDSGSGRQAQD